MEPALHLPYIMGAKIDGVLPESLCGARADIMGLEPQAIPMAEQLNIKDPPSSIDLITYARAIPF